MYFRQHDSRRDFQRRFFRDPPPPPDSMRRFTSFIARDCVDAEEAAVRLAANILAAAAAELGFRAPPPPPKIPLKPPPLLPPLPPPPLTRFVLVPPLPLPLPPLPSRPLPPTLLLLLLLPLPPPPPPPPPLPPPLPLPTEKIDEDLMAALFSLLFLSKMFCPVVARDRNAARAASASSSVDGSSLMCSGNPAAFVSALFSAISLRWPRMARLRDLLTS